MIEEKHTRFVASAEVDDDCMVEVRLRRPRLSLVPAVAREFAAEVVRAADDAERVSAELLHPVVSSKFDRPAVIAPDCRDGKHQACIGDAWSTAEDAPAPCDCSCHAIPEAAAA